MISSNLMIIFLFDGPKNASKELRRKKNPSIPSPLFLIVYLKTACLLILKYESKKIFGSIKLSVFLDNKNDSLLTSSLTQLQIILLAICTL